MIGRKWSVPLAALLAGISLLAEVPAWGSGNNPGFQIRPGPTPDQGRAVFSETYGNRNDTGSFTSGASTGAAEGGNLGTY